MPGDRKSRLGEALCYCGLEKYGSVPHRVSVRTRYRHMAEADANDAVKPMEIDNELDEEMREDGPQEEHMGNRHDDRDMDDYSDYGPSEASSTLKGWEALDTPPASPPPMPPQSPTPEDDEPEDDFARITAEDYREYDCWFGEDQHELDEIAAEMLTEEEMDTIKMTAICLFGHISERNYECVRFSFRNKVHFLSIYRTTWKLAQLSGTQPQSIDCCINVCHAFTGPYAEETICSKCKEPRYDSKKRPRQVFEYLPMNPRLRGLFNNPTMVEKMYYRANYVQEDGAMDDYLDGEQYKKLRRSRIVVEGEDLGVSYFSGSCDIAYAVLTDGVEIFEKAHQEASTCWPIMAINLNLPASERLKLRNLIPLGVIPGPHKPGDFDSFLQPFVEEAIEQARGFQAYDITKKRNFTLRAHPIMILGDMQAIKYVSKIKGTKGKKPCCGCESCRIYHRECRTYYLLLANPTDNPECIPDERVDPDTSPNVISSLDPYNLQLRTSHRIAKQLRNMDAALTECEYNNLARDYGLTGHSILDRIPSIRRPDSYPHEFLHLFLLNHRPELVELWAGTKGPNNTSDYILTSQAWATIGHETEETSKTIPAAFVRPLPNIATCWASYCGESWCFWLVYIGPIVLRGRLLEKYYNHYMELVKIIKCLLLVTNTTARIEQLRHEIVRYVEKYEELSVCKTTLHALLHVANDVLRCGPVWVAWSFSVERYCREITFCAKSKVIPYKTINKHVLQLSQVASISCRFPEIQKALLFGKNDAPAPISRMEYIYPEYENENIILRFPRLRGFLLKPNVRKRVAQFFCTNNTSQTYRAWLDFIPERCERWGKLRIADGGDSIRSAIACNPLAAYGRRDSSFVRFEFQKDKNEDDPNAEIEMIDAIGYGRLDFILAITLPRSQEFHIDIPTTHILAHITEAKDVEGDGATEILRFSHFGWSVVLNITSIKHVAGRVFTQGMRQMGEWAIVDRSEGVARTDFQVDEHGSDDEEGWEN
ncbi:Transposase family Tnp2 protein [Ceratobasidium theobromae]|uniref:Transposase family Tnp2 protein n=1 Tax=Ceratobasidium theobromae TaxID=1582974 RepID=A0A5N5Q951_9AGAM|nr:Transposase family Tnp2 protein [Ceratobasidium theobromae]